MSLRQKTNTQHTQISPYHLQPAIIYDVKPQAYKQNPSLYYKAIARARIARMLKFRIKNTTEMILKRAVAPLSLLSNYIVFFRAGAF